jgi:hypothetical protein
MGVATQNITANSKGYVTSFGMVSDLNTWAFNAGDILYLSPNTQGVLTSTEPTAPNTKISIAACAVKSNNPSATNGRIFVRPQVGSRLFDLSDVNITTPTTGQALVYNGNIWVNDIVNFANTAGQSNTANTAATVTTNAQPNITSVGTLTGLTVNGVSNLSSNSNVKITGGSSGQLLSTDGVGNLSWITLSASQISNGTSNVSIPTANGNILLSSNGVSNVMTITDSQAIIGAPTAYNNVSINTQNDIVAANRRMGPAPGYAWTLSTTTAPNYTRAAYGDGKFVVCANGNVGYSYDGIRWVNAVLSGNWRGIAYGNGLFVIVGQNIISTSPDGITWTSRTSPANVTWFDVTYGNGQFVACANGGTTSNTIMTSPDGITWTLRSTPASGEFVSIAYGAGTYVTVTFFGGGIMSSTDGITWTSRTNPSVGSYWSIDVAYGNGLFVAVSNQTNTGRIVTSPDGITWTIRNSTATLGSISYGDGLWVALGSDANKLWTSLDGITWINRPFTASASDVDDIVYANGLFVGVGPSVIVRSGTLIDNDPTDNNKFYGDWQFTSNLRIANVANVGSIVTTGNIGNANVITANTANVITISVTGNITTGNLIANTDILVGNLSVGTKIIPQNSQSANYNIVAADSGKQLFHPSADTTARTFTIPANSNVAFSVGTTITFINQASAGNITIAVTDDTIRLAGNGATGNRLLASNGIATTVKITGTEWIISGVNLT